MIPAFTRFLCIAIPVGLLAYRLYSRYPIHSLVLITSLLFNGIAERQYYQGVRIPCALFLRNLIISVILDYANTVPNVILSPYPSVQSLLES